MEIERWRPKQELSEQEERIIERMKRTGKLFARLAPIGGSRPRRGHLQPAGPCRTRALQVLIQQLDCLVRWLRQVLPEQLEEQPLAGHLETLEHLRGLDLIVACTVVRRTGGSSW